MKSRIQHIAAAALVALVTLTATQYSTAQTPAKKFDTPEKKICYASKNLLVALNSGNNGMIEAAMRVTAQMKMRYPNADVSSLVESINNIQQNHPSGVIRYKAYITRAMCEEPGWYSSQESIEHADDLTFYKAASKRLHEQLLSVNSR